MNNQRSRILLAVEALKSGDRRRAARLLDDELKVGPATGSRWTSVSKLAFKIGEIETGLEASRRAANTMPRTLDSLLNYCGDLAGAGRSSEALQLINRLPKSVQNHAAVSHFQASVASEHGDFEKAKVLLQKALAVTPTSPHFLFALAMLKRFQLNDKDFGYLKAAEKEAGRYDGKTQARLQYAIAKAHIDVGDIDTGFAYYDRGARLRSLDEAYDSERTKRFADKLISDFSTQGLGRLAQSTFAGSNAIFVNGLPRSGSTLVESILVSHSKVSDGAEINLMQPALIPTIDYSYQGALRYQTNLDGKDPWGAIASDYHRMISERFPNGQLIVDKTLNQSMLMGLILHCLPDARVIWMRRNAADNALSAYTAYFTSAIPWSWCLKDMAAHFRLEDRLFAHWKSLYPDRIMELRYEDLVTDPSTWIGSLLNHVGLPHEPQVYDFHKSKRPILTASVQQVRSKISDSSVGKSQRFLDQLSPFLNTYYK